MNHYEPGDFLELSDAPEEDKEEYRRLSSETEDNGQSNGGAAGCVFGVALIAGCLFLAWALTQTGGMW